MLSKVCGLKKKIKKLYFMFVDEILYTLSYMQRWHQDYRNFRETTMFLMVGLEFFQKKR